MNRRVQDEGPLGQAQFALCVFVRKPIINRAASADRANPGMPFLAPSCEGTKKPGPQPNPVHPVNPVKTLPATGSRRHGRNIFFTRRREGGVFRQDEQEGTG